MLQLREHQSVHVPHVNIPAATVDAAPPVIVPTARPQHPVYGNIPIGEGEWKLENQSIEMLDQWHKKATALMDAFPRSEFDDPAREDEYNNLHTIEWALFRASFKASLNSSRRVARLMEIVVRHCEHNSTELSIDELKIVRDALAETTASEVPTKRVGPLCRGKKLTRAGLLHRYHAFLIGELSTLGIAFYGNRDYPLEMMPLDHAVNVRTRSGFKNGRYDASQNRRKQYPIFDESKLTDRARSVLKSLKIETVIADDRLRLPKSQRVSYADACKKAGAR